MYTRFPSISRSDIIAVQKQCTTLYLSCCAQSRPHISHMPIKRCTATMLALPVKIAKRHTLFNAHRSHANSTQRTCPDEHPFPINVHRTHIRKVDVYLTNRYSLKCTVTAQTYGANGAVKGLGLAIDFGLEMWRLGFVVVSPRLHLLIGSRRDR